MDKHFYIVERINKKARYTLIILLIFFFASIYGAIYIRNIHEEIGQILVIVSMSLFFMTGITHLLRSFVATDYKEIGVIKFRLDGVEIEQDSQKINYQYKDLTDIMIIYGGYKGKMFSGTQSFYSYDGSNNKIRFKHDTLRSEFRYLVPNLKSEKWIHIYVDKLIKSGYPIIFNNSDNTFRSRFGFRSPAANNV